MNILKPKILKVIASGRNGWCVKHRKRLIFSLSLTTLETWTDLEPERLAFYGILLSYHLSPEPRLLVYLICKIKYISLKDHKHGENTGQKYSLHLQISDNCLIQGSTRKIIKMIKRDETAANYLGTSVWEGFGVYG